MDGVQFLMSEVVGISGKFSDWNALKCLIENVIPSMYFLIAYKFRIVGSCQNVVLLNTGM
jgi:hypothetical protein